MSVLALDIETKNLSHEIGGWHNTHMFKVSTICTWDGDIGTIYIDKAVDDGTLTHQDTYHTHIVDIFHLCI